MAKTITIEDFEFICRVCLKFSDDLVLISENEIITMMSSCTSVQIWLNDDLPNHLCNTCFIDLKNAFNFKQLSENSDNSLRHIVSEHNLGNKLVAKSDTDWSDKHIIKDEENFDDNFIDSVKCEFESDCETKIKDDYENTKNIIIDDTKTKNIYAKKQYACEKCHLKFSHLRHLGLHMKRQHKSKGEFTGKDNRVPCDVCGKHVLKRNIKRHLNVHKNDRDLLQCDKCEKKFLHASSLKLHIKRDHEKIARELNHLCNTCGKKYASRFALKQHTIVHATVTSDIYTWYVRVPCNVCGKQISNINMKQHLKIHRNDRALIKCDKCSKQFLHQLSLKQHIRREHENIARDLKHLCNICGKGAVCRAELQEHMRSHSDEKNLECDKCGMKYKSRSGLTHHIKTAHLNIKPHACTLCTQRFAIKSKLASHMRTHTGERPFQCVVCERSFSHKSNLRTHMKNGHTN